MLEPHRTFEVHTSFSCRDRVTVTVNMFLFSQSIQHKRNKKMKQIKEYGCAGRKENGRWGPQGHPKNPDPNKSKNKR